MLLEADSGVLSPARAPGVWQGTSLGSARFRVLPITLQAHVGGAGPVLDGASGPLSPCHVLHFTEPLILRDLTRPQQSCALFSLLGRELTSARSEASVQELVVFHAGARSFIPLHILQGMPGFSSFIPIHILQGMPGCSSFIPIHIVHRNS